MVRLFVALFADGPPLALTRADQGTVQIREYDPRAIPRPLKDQSFHGDLRGALTRRVHGAERGALLWGEWPEGNLQGAQLELAAVVERVAKRWKHGVVVDVLSMVAFPWREYVERMKQRPGPGRCYWVEVHSQKNRKSAVRGQAAWAQTYGLAKLGQSELAVEFVDTPSSRDEALGLVRTLTDAALARPKGLRAGDSVTFGWSSLILGTAPADAKRFETPKYIRLALQRFYKPDQMLVVHERVDDIEPEYAPGASRAIDIRLRQRAALREHEMDPDSMPPPFDHTAVVCRKVKLPMRPVLLGRFSSLGGRDSGWVIRCMDDRHDHSNKGDFEVRELAKVAHLDREILNYLAFPRGATILLREDGAVESWPPEAEEPQRSTG